MNMPQTLTCLKHGKVSSCLRPRVFEVTDFVLKLGAWDCRMSPQPALILATCSVQHVHARPSAIKTENQAQDKMVRHVSSCSSLCSNLKYSVPKSRLGKSGMGGIFWEQTGSVYAPLQFSFARCYCSEYGRVLFLVLCWLYGLHPFRFWSQV